VNRLLGIHHVTAIVEDPQENIDFYATVLGLRLVKQTVNFDDPYTYHLYYGDELGRPGTLVTFFPWPDGRRGSRGAGQINAMAFAVPVGALSFWQQRLTAYDWRFGGPEDRAGAAVLSLYDPAGLLLELVEQPSAERGSARSGDVPPDAAIQRLFGVSLTLAQAAPTAAFLTDQLGFRAIEGRPGLARYAAGAGVDASVVDLIERPDVPRGQIAAGSIHHVAWRVADAGALQGWLHKLTRQGANVTPIRDRQYFRSIYFREPGGVLFEIATDAPGFAIDEPPAELGARLMLPAWLEPQRANIERRLLPIRVPGVAPLEHTAGGPAPAAQAEENISMELSKLSFVHQFVPAQADDAPTLLLLHGTGGNEHDLLDLGRSLFPRAALLSPRGQVLENGMPRFFRRLAEGVFDVDDLRRRTHDLAAFVAEASQAYHFDPRRVIAVGYSNGANIAASLLLLRPEVLAGAVLFHAMLPLVPEQLPDLRGVPVFMGAGRVDPLIAPPQTERLAQLLREAGADVDLRWQPGGHTLSQAEAAAATTWLGAHNSAQPDRK
jgi:predicted esterase/catechol 2,3-dioxygenase-like lactoylglutathione lyase family enzyme